MVWFAVTSGCPVCDSRAKWLQSIRLQDFGLLAKSHRIWCSHSLTPGTFDLSILPRFSSQNDVLSLSPIPVEDTRLQGLRTCMGQRGVRGTARLACNIFGAVGIKSALEATAISAVRCRHFLRFDLTERCSVYARTTCPVQPNRAAQVLQLNPKVFLSKSLNVSSSFLEQTVSALKDLVVAVDSPTQFHVSGTASTVLFCSSEST